MRNETREKFNAYIGRQAQLNGIPDATVKFNATPSIQQTLETKMQESSAFLTSINMVPVQDQQGEKVGVGVSTTIASNTDTTSQDRQTQDPHETDATGYHCRQNNFDTHIRYATLDMWAKFQDFQIRIRDAILKRQALDRMMIGFNGTSYAATSNRATNPLLQDVNIGWLQKYRAHAAARVMTEGAAAGVIAAYAGGDYEHLDALVYDARSSLLEPWYQEDPELVAILGRDLLHDKYFPIVNQNHAPTETLAADMVISQKRVGGLPAVSVPFFPADKIMITPLSNLSLYFQEGARRRHIMDNPKRDRIENYESSNDDYVVEDYGRGCLIENIVTVNPAP
ncbi:phage major capsid protein, P2 family [Nitrincola iocasae]|uniref:Phage major capsid protein, P2 family n=1 Tax=Nitrincola iocasae TaxID=2614693 RepID=A0A5J6LDF9_9GAMM|nr:phage major capsid protein, P2 family [Nitrincola iocasae]QEW06368.1 phage major capsid protein, P2 family [Nitrincola iocasae]